MGGGGHGHSHGSGRGGRSPSADVDTDSLYKTLGVEKAADEKAIKTAFRKAALQHHPDRGGDADKFKEVNKVRQR